MEDNLEQAVPEQCESCVLRNTCAALGCTKTTECASRRLSNDDWRDAVTEIRR